MQTQQRCDEAAAGGERALTNPRLTANLRGDYEALENDVEQARVLAADFQSQLAGKSNEMAHLKQVFEKTARDLANLQEGITALREERHRLANEAMRAIALEHRLNRMEAENERLTAEVGKLNQQLAAVRTNQPVVSAPRVENAEAQALLTAAADSLERLREIVNSKGAAPQTRHAAIRPAIKEDFIDISFEP